MLAMASQVYMHYEFHKWLHNSWILVLYVECKQYEAMTIGPSRLFF